MSFEPIADSRPNDSAWPEAVWPPAEDLVLRNEFVELRMAAEADAAGLFEVLNHEDVWKHVKGRPSNVEEMRQSIYKKQILVCWHPWTVRTLKPVGGFPAGAIVGTTSFLETWPEDARTEIGSTTYAPSVWGSFVNPATKLLLLEFAFESLHMGRVQLKTDVRNQRSQRAIARLGAQYEGTLRRYQSRADCSVRDTILFSIVAEEWPKVKQSLENRLASE
jgi:RimJ/RimL family protein N-acetyltransferase